MIDTQNMNSIFDAKVIDKDGDKVGTVKQVYVDQNDGHPIFASVATGLFGTSESFVPIEAADITGDELRVDYDKATIKDAPRIDADGELSDAEQDSIWDHYGLSDHTSDHASDHSTDHTSVHTSDDSTDHASDRSTTDTTTSDHAATGTTDTSDGVTHGAGQDTSGPNTDDAMTRSEERLDVGTEKVQAGRARLRKHIVTEQQSVTVPVQHEELRVESEPITDANVGAATDGPALSEEEHEVVLNEERVVVAKETVPVERVRVGKETVTEQQQVDEEVAHEEIELDDGTGNTGRTGTDADRL